MTFTFNDNSCTECGHCNWTAHNDRDGEVLYYSCDNCHNVEYA